MKKYTTVNDSDRKGFANYCDAVKNMETDKDKFLEAARLERHEKQARPFKETLLLILIPCLVFLLAAILAFGYFSGHFVPALTVCGVVVFVALMGGLAMA